LRFALFFPPHFSAVEFDSMDSFDNATPLSTVPAIDTAKANVVHIIHTMPYPLLAVSALGPLEISLDGDNVGGWQYLDSVELLLYLLLNSESASAQSTPKTSAKLHGKTKEQIGAALFPEASPSQLQANLKVRLRDVRRVLGSRDWVLFESEQYKFNYTLPCAFDVRAFQDALRAADKSLRAADNAAALAELEKAVTLYRGDLLLDYRKRSSAGRARFGDEDEIEWYVQKRYELQAELRDALEKLGALQIEGAHYAPAADTYRRLISADEYDDSAHRHLMLALAYQGKRSQALSHYRQLLRQRADTPPDTETDVLAEQIKRGEITARAQKTTAAANLFAAALPSPFQPPADLPRFVGRAAPLRELETAISSAQRGALYCIIGMGGIGKTTLALRLAHALRDQFPDGVLWGHVATSEPLAILDSWARAFGCDYSSLPDIETRAASLRSLLSGKKILFLLDDVWDAARVRPLLLNGVQHHVLMTTRNADLASALDAHTILLPVLARDESTDLFSRILGADRVSRELDTAQEISVLLGHLPLAIDITAHRLASRPRWTLREMADRLQQQVRRLDELQFGDRAVRAAFEISWETLPSHTRALFAQIGVFEARSFRPPAAAVVASIPETQARQELDTLAALSLVSVQDNGRYHQHPLLADFALEKLPTISALAPNVTALNQESEIINQQSPVSNYPLSIINHHSPAHARLAQYYLSFATDHHRDYLALEEEWDNLNAGIETARRLEMWQTLIDYGDVLTEPWIVRGRFSDARRAYPHVMQAARELEEQDPYIAAGLNWGKACLDQSDYAEAQAHLEHGLQTSREVGDAYGIATAQFLLARLAVIQSKFDEAEPRLDESEAQYQKVNDRAGLAQVYYMRARIRMTQGDYAQAEQWGSRSLDLLTALEPSHARIVMLRYMGRILDYLDRVEEALEYGREAIALAEALGDVGEKASGQYDLAANLRSRGRLREALEYATTALPDMQSMGDRQSEMLLREELSTIQFGLKDFPAAILHGERALALAREIGDREGELLDLIRLGDIFEAAAQVQSACRTRAQALPLAQDAGHARASQIETWLREHCT
jgi:DNA-binding SARP family transcriptional activator